jgi:SPP1 gp7 family putative phage head morphogenesis protein
MGLKIKRRPPSRFKWRAGQASKGATALYYRNLRKLVTRLEQWTDELIYPVVKRQADINTSLIDAVDVPGIDAALSEFNRRLSLLELGEKGIEMVEPALYENDQFNRRAFISGLKQVIGVDVSTVLNESFAVRREMDQRIVENVKLIKSIPEQYLDSLAKTIQKGMLESDDYRSIRKQILKLGQSTKKRARFIARDQMSKFTNALNKTRQKNVGITRYTWRSSRDSRVSDEHKAHDGKVFEWAKPPTPDGHPGDRPNCRCYGEPYLQDLRVLINRQIAA